MTMHARRALAVVVSAALLVATACGSTNDEEGADSAEAGREVLGVTDDEITVGIEYTVGGDEAFEASGAEGISVGDMRSIYEALIDDVNANGGVLGRDLAPVFHATDVTAETGAAAEEQAMCAAFTQDAEVFAAVILGSSDVGLECLDEAGVVAIGPGVLSSADQELFEQFPLYLEAGSLRLDLMAEALVETLVDEEFLTPADRVGVILPDDPAFVRTLEDALVPALDEAGIELAHEVRVPADTEEAASAAVQSSVLGFRDADVDRVVLLESGGALLLYFLTAAEAQGYRPRYAVTTQSGGSVIVPNVPPAQLEEAMGIGWTPEFDIPESELESWPARTDCIERLAPDGGFADSNARTIALDACSQMDLLVAGLEASDEPSADAFVTGVEGLGDSLGLASTPESRYGSDRHDGVGAVRTVAFDTACTCFRYRGDPRPVE